MKKFLAYTRVSTMRQGEEGISLQEQKQIILEYASKRGITIAEWFEEQESAAKRGRAGLWTACRSPKIQTGRRYHPQQD